MDVIGGSNTTAVSCQMTSTFYLGGSRSWYLWIEISSMLLDVANVIEARGKNQVGRLLEK